MILMLSISGFYNIATAAISNGCSSGELKTDFCSQGFIGSVTIANKRANIGSIRIQLTLNLVSVTLLSIFFHYMRFKFRKIVSSIDKEVVSPADFTLIMKGVNPSVPNEGVIKWLKGYATEQNSINIKKINRSYDIKDYIHLLHERKTLAKERDQKAYKKKNKEANQLQMRIEKIESNLEDLKKKKFIYTPFVFVTLKKASRKTKISFSLINDRSCLPS